MGHEDNFDYDSVGEGETEIVGHSPAFKTNIAYHNMGDNIGMVHALTSCCNAAAKMSADGDVFCKGCYGHINPSVERAGDTTDLLRNSQHPSNVIKQEFGELSPPKPLAPANQARVDQQDAERKDRYKKTAVIVEAARLSGICRNCSSLRDTHGNCGCNE